MSGTFFFESDPVRPLPLISKGEAAVTSFWWVTTGFLALGTRGDLLSVPTALYALFLELPLVVCLMAIQVPVPEPSRSVVLLPDLLVF